VFVIHLPAVRSQSFSFKEKEKDFHFHQGWGKFIFFPESFPKVSLF